MKSEEIIKLLENVPASIKDIETKTGMPKTTLQKAMKGDRELPKKWAIKLKTYVELKHYLVTKMPKKEATEKKPEKKQKDKSESTNGLTPFQIYQRQKLGIK